MRTAFRLLILAVFGSLANPILILAQSTQPTEISQPKADSKSLQWDGNLLVRELQLAVGHPFVATELGLLPYQLEQLKELQYNIQNEITTAVREYSRVGAEQRNQQLQKVYANAREAADRVLLPRQTQRLRQLAIQSTAPHDNASAQSLVAILQNPMIRDHLGIDESIVKKLAEKARVENEKLQKEIQVLRERANAAVLAELPSNTQQQINDLVGAPFDFGNYELGRNGVFRRNDDK